MTLREFAEAHVIRVKRDACGEQIIPGRVGHVYEHNARTFGLLLMFATSRPWSYAKKKLAAASFTIRQDADTEGTALFDPANWAQARLALKIAGVRRKRTASAAERQRLAAAGRASRFSATTALDGRMGR